MSHDLCTTANIHDCILLDQATVAPEHVDLVNLLSLALTPFDGLSNKSGNLQFCSSG